MLNVVEPLPSDLPCSLYVYYRVSAGQEAAAVAAVESMQAQLRQNYPGLRTRLMYRPGAVDPARGVTWMEVYEHDSGVSSNCLAELQRLCEALPAGMTSERHIEVFCPLLPGAALQP